MEVYARMGRKLPKRLVLGHNGEYMVDPDRILSCLPRGEAALLPLGGAREETGGYKGYG
jgi:L-2-hydroxycarboxylate dehydrogenase (NAD+)